VQRDVVTQRSIAIFFCSAVCERRPARTSTA
jgi:hypothetical protein